MAIERTVTCRVRNVSENQVVHSLSDKYPRVISVDVDMERDDVFTDPFRVSLSVSSDNQPKIGDRYVITIRPATEGDD